MYYVMDKEIFALDIGTRKVMGIVARNTEEAIEILAWETIEHPSRPMLDGQIQNIEDVAKTVKKIKSALEKKLGIKLDKVGVAVAGRDLLTYKNKTVRNLEFAEEITAQAVKDLELEAVDSILSDSQKNISSRFYCAGYSPVYYELDGNKLSNLIGHRGKTIGCEIIVTLLPRVVLDSMFTVLKKAGLEPTNVTLEPIAAINAIVPEEIRNLNIMLADIGAGTSDLALIKDGFIYAYGMVPSAGDEITEHIAHNLLVDFLTAEGIKRSISKNIPLDYADIWGRKHEISPEALNEIITPAVKKLADCVTENAFALSSDSPQAIITVGGGSLTHNLIRELAASFGLSPERIGIRLPRTIKSLIKLPPELDSPEAVTPIGITLMTAQSNGLSFIEAEVNGKKVKMLDFKQKKDILGALTLAEAINNKKLYPKPGLALTCYLNGELKFIKGSLGTPARILLNSKPVESLSEKLKHGDKIEFTPAVDGENAAPAIRDILRLEPLEVFLNGEKIICFPTVKMNSKDVSADEPVLERSDIQIISLRAKDILRLKDIELDGLFEKQILISINENPRLLTQTNFTLKANGSPCSLESLLRNNDILEFSFAKPAGYKIKDVVKIAESKETLHINVDEKAIEVEYQPLQIFMNGKQAGSEEPLVDGAQLKVYYLKERRVLLSDIFRHIDFDPRHALGKKMKILVNDTPAGFTTPLAEGSRVRILFEDREEYLNEDT